MTSDEPTVLEAALALADVNLRDRHGPENSVRPWYMAPMGPTDHIYPQCPGLRRSLRPGEEPVQGAGALYPEAGDVCGWCLRLWRTRKKKAANLAARQQAKRDPAVPTLAQMQNLADRAEDGPLAPAEAARLRAGIAAYDARRRSYNQSRRAIRQLRRRLHEIHAPLLRGGIQVCTVCSGWNGTRCVGLITEWPCETLDCFDRTFPTEARP